MSDPKSNPTRQQKNHKTRLSPDGQSPNRPQPETGDHLRPLKVDPGGGGGVGGNPTKKKKKGKNLQNQKCNERSCTTRYAKDCQTARTRSGSHEGAITPRKSSHTYHNQQDLDPNGYYDHAASIR